LSACVIPEPAKKKDEGLGENKPTPPALYANKVVLMFGGVPITAGVLLDNKVLFLYAKILLLVSTPV
jgi:hypothetical protein